MIIIITIEFIRVRVDDHCIILIFNDNELGLRAIFSVFLESNCSAVDYFFESNKETRTKNVTIIICRDVNDALALSVDSILL